MESCLVRRKRREPTVLCLRLRITSLSCLSPVSLMPNIKGRVIEQRKQGLRRSYSHIVGWVLKFPQLHPSCSSSRSVKMFMHVHVRREVNSEGQKNKFLNVIDIDNRSFVVLPSKTTSMTVEMIHLSIFYN